MSTREGADHVELDEQSFNYDIKRTDGDCRGACTAFVEGTIMRRELHSVWRDDGPMKAVVVTAFGRPDVLRYVDKEMPVPGPGEVRIRTVATSVNFADVMARQGRYHAGGQPPFVPGLDVAGTVDELGEGVDAGWQGKRVVAFPSGGSYSEYVVAKVDLTYEIPENLDWHTAAGMLTVAVTSYELLTKVTQLAAGERVLVHAAAGGVGSVALQLARHLGASRVIGVVGSTKKMEFASTHGADVVIKAANGGFAEGVLEATERKGVDVILDSVAGDGFAENLRCLAPFGRIAAFGSASGKPGQVQTQELHGSCRSVRGYSMGTTRRLRPQTLRPSVDAVLGLAASGKLHVPVSARFPLEDCKKAHELLESRQSTGKIVLVVQP